MKGSDESGSHKNNALKEDRILSFATYRNSITPSDTKNELHFTQPNSNPITEQTSHEHFVIERCHFAFPLRREGAPFDGSCPTHQNVLRIYKK